MIFSSIIDFFRSRKKEKNISKFIKEVTFENFGSKKNILFDSLDVLRRVPFEIIPDKNEEKVKELEDLFSESSYAAFPIAVLQLKHVYVDGHRGVCVTMHGQMIKETSRIGKLIDNNLSYVPFVSMCDNKFIGGDFRVEKNPVLHCIHGSAAAYGHFMFDVLPAVSFFRAEILSGKMKLLMPNFPLWGKKIFETLGIRDDMIVDMGTDSVICENIIITNTVDAFSSFYPQPEFARLPAVSLGLDIKSWDTKGSEGKKIYISRDNQTNYSSRILSNDEEIREVLLGLGFEIIEPGNMSFSDQVKIFNSASLVVGVHGPGFGNLIFSKPETVVIDLMPDKYIGFHVKPKQDEYTGFKSGGSMAERWLLNVTTCLDLKYNVFLCQSEIFNALPDTDNSGWERKGIKFHVDAETLKKIILEKIETLPT